LKIIFRYLILIFYISGSIFCFLILNIFFFHLTFYRLLIDWSFLISFLLYFLTIEELYQWAKNGKRSEMSDIIAISFFFFLIFFFSKDFLTSLMGAFSIYLWFGIYELKDYPIINKILIISLVTYNVIFIAGIISFYLNDPFYINTSFAFSIWIILILGFILFGRKYIIVWRFMSPEYLILFLYIIAWLGIVLINQFTPLTFILNKSFNIFKFKFSDFFLNIYFILIIVNWIIYFSSGIILDKFLGIRKVRDNNILELINQVKTKMGIKSEVKIGYGEYPILNAMAYGSIFDKRVAIIAENLNKIPEDELKGIVAHEFAHIKGKHTLILTFITTGDLFMRMLLGIPATYYDYTFGKPQIPMFNFILLNLLIYIFLFIFVRILEGKADMKAKKAGYSNELVKALYNLESFYANGREIGFNTMLLSKEKISKDNQLLDYMSTASYLHNSMIKPSRLSLISNFLNSHPPSFYRIAAILSNELRPGKEAILPLICLKKSKQKKYAQQFEKARLAFKDIVNNKFKELFGVNDISLVLNNLRRRELYKYDLNKDYLFKNKITSELKLGRLKDVKFLDDLCSSDQFMIRNIKSNQPETIEAKAYSRIRIDLNKNYFLNKEEPLTLTDIEIKTKSNNNSSYLFKDKNGNTILKSVLKTKLPNSVKFLEDFKDNDVFLKIKGELKIFKCIDIIHAEKLDDYKIKLSKSKFNEVEIQESIVFPLKEIIIKPRKIYLEISKGSIFRKSEIKIINWLLDNHQLAYFYLKKPVNNMEIGYIRKVKLDKSNNRNPKNKNSLVIENIFGKEVIIPYNTLDMITFEYKTAVIQIKSGTSISSRLGYKILKKIKPQRIIFC